MKHKTLLLAASMAMGLAQAPSHAAIVGPVNVLSQVNDGTLPLVCGSTADTNAHVGGLPEMALDLDQDGLADMCLGSSSGVCTSGFNLDAVSLNTTLLMATGTNSFMDGNNATLSFWDGKPLGPFQAATGPVGSANIGASDVPMVFGFKGGSNTPATSEGYFSLTVKGSDCSISLGKVDITAGQNSFSNSVVASAPAPAPVTPAVAPVPVSTPTALLALAAALGFFGFSRLRRQR